MATDDSIIKNHLQFISVVLMFMVMYQKQAEVM